MGPQEIIGCFIPECVNTSEDPPNKRFVRVPCLPKLRQLWVKAGLRLKVKVPMVDKSPMFCCEDHFDLNLDATRQWLDENINEKGSFIKLKRGVLPHIFPSKQKLNAAARPKKRSEAQSNCQKPCEVFKTEVLEIGGSLENIDGNSSKRVFDKVNENVQRSLDKNKSVTILNPVNTSQVEKCENKISEKSSNKINHSNKKIVKRKLSSCDDYRQLNSLNGNHSSEQIEKKMKSNCKKDQSENNIIATEIVGNVDEACIKSEITKEKSDIEELQSKEAESMDELLKRKVLEGQLSTIETESIQADYKDKESSRNNKKRRVVKEILAWIPSSPSVVPQLRASNPMQPFIVVQTPISSTSGPAPVLHLPAVPGSSNGPSVATVPLAAGKETQFILTVPDNGAPLGCTSNQQLVLAVPQGCSFSVDRLSNDAEDRGVINPTSESSLGSSNISFDYSNQEINKSDNISELDSFNTNNIVKPQINKTLSEAAVSANTPLTPHTFKVAETPNLRIVPAQPQPCCTCRCTAAISSDKSSDKPRESEAELSKNFRLFLDEFRSIKKTMESVNKELNLLRTDNIELKAQNKLLLDQTKGRVFCDESKKLEIVANTLKERFTPNQVTLLLSKPDSKTRVNWTVYEINSSYSLYSMSPQAYKFLHSSLKYPIPSVTTLKRYIERQGGRLKIPNSISFDEEYDSEEEVELDEGAIKRLEMMEKLSEKYPNINRFGSGQSKVLNRTVNKTSMPMKTVKLEKDEIMPRVVRVDLQNNALLNKQYNASLPKANLVHKPALSNLIKTVPIKPKVVQVQRPLVKPNSEKIICPNVIKPIIREVVRVKKEVVEPETIDISQNHRDNSMLIKMNNNSGEMVLKPEANINKRSMPSINTEVKTEILNYNNDNQVKELVISQAYQRNMDANVTDIVNCEEEITIENVPQVVETSDGSKIIRIQVEPLQGEDGTLYEEVVIHCDDASMFDNEVVGLAFGHDDNMEETAFL